MISSIINLVHELPHDLPDVLRRRMLGNKEIIGKSQIWMQTKASAKSTRQKLNSANSSQTARRSRCQTPLALSNPTGSLYPPPNTPSRIAWANKALALTRLSLLQTNFLTFYISKHSPIFKENIKQVSCVKLPNLMVLRKQCFANLV